MDEFLPPKSDTELNEPPVRRLALREPLPSGTLTLSNVVHGLMAGLIGVLVSLAVLLATALSFADANELGRFLLVLASVWIVVIELPFCVRMLQATLVAGSVNEPLMLGAAKAQSRYSTLLRPLLSPWWFSHMMLSLIVPISIVLAQPNVQIVGTIFIALLTAVFCSLSFGFLLMAWACFDPNPSRLLRLWEYRWWWGLFCGLVFIAVDAIMRWQA